MAQAMTKILAVAMLIITSACASAQTFCASGACWTYRAELGLGAYRLYHYQHVGDTLLNGIAHQRIDSRTRDYYPWGTNDWPDFTELIRMEGAAVISDHSNMTWNTNGEWDTIQYYGNIGDHWWPANADEGCPPQGMLQIMDTGSVVIDGVSLRTWQMAYLDINGVPIMVAAPLAPFTLTERIGMAPRMPHTHMCGITETTDIELIAYSDADITFPPGSVCGLPMSTDANKPMVAAALYPNPSSERFWVIGLSTSTSVEVHDPLGRLVHSRSNLSMNTPIETASWESGTYFITVAQADGARDLLRWVKQ